MKKVFLIVLMIAVIGLVAGGIFLYWQSTRPPLAVEAILPPQPLIFVHMKDIEKNLDEFSQTRFWQILKGIDYIKYIKESGGNEEALERYNTMMKQLFSEEMKIFVKTFLGKEVVLAVYPGKENSLDSQNMMEVASQTFLVTRLKPELKFAEKFSGLMGKIDPNISVEEVNYEKNKIYLISVKGAPFKIGYTRIKNLLVVGINDQAARRCIDIYKKKDSASLRADADYLRVRSHAHQDADFLGYMNFVKLIEDLKAQIVGWLAANGEDSALFLKQVEDSFRQAKGFQMMSLSALPGPQTRLKLDIHYDRDALEPDVRPLYECAPQENASLQFIPRDVLGYQWSPCYDFEYYWQQAPEKMGDALLAKGVEADPEEFIAGLEQALGINVKNDLIPALGREMGWFWTDVSLDQLVPVPQLAFYIKTADQEKVKTLIRDLIAKQSFVRAETETVDGEDIYFFKIPMIENLEPTYSFLDGYLIIATSRDLIRQAKAAKAGDKPSILKQADFQEPNLGLSAKNNAVVFLNVQGIAQKADSILEWGAGWADQQIAKQKAFRDGTERRMQDVIDDIVSNKDQVSSLEAEIESLKEQKDAIVEQPEEVLKVDREIERIDKFLENLEKSLEPDREEERQLKSVQDDENFLLPPEGLARLKFLQDSIKKKQTKKDSLNEEKQAFLNQREDLTSVDRKKAKIEQAIADKTEEIERLKGGISAGIDTQAELEAMLMEIDSRKTLTPAQREDVIQGLVKPLIQAVGQISTFSAKVNLGPKIIEMESFLKIK
ncbi:MAG TPA: hypothetical protein PLB05_00710 [Candidatus Omnitrophota bacterium]|nr:hypothetical protein [Candidatus Omnitrophota bacterium]